MRLTVVVVLLAAVLAGCATSQDRVSGPDDLCREMANFANASDDGKLHEVRLATDWGGTYCPHDEGEVVIACKWCTHDSPTSGQRLCDYLTSEHTATEFSRINFLRALDCLNLGYERQHTQWSNKTFDGRQIWSTHVGRVRRGIAVGVEFNDKKDEPPTLVIYAQRRGV